MGIAIVAITINKPPTIKPRNPLIRIVNKWKIPEPVDLYDARAKRERQSGHSPPSGPLLPQLQ